jgi:hypothetical protein
MTLNYLRKIRLEIKLRFKSSILIGAPYGLMRARTGTFAWRVLLATLA